VLCGLPLIVDNNVLRGMESLDDAGVYKLSNDLALIQTLDFFTPIVDDPYSFGQIAVANALSDVYAMGGKPLTAMNIVCFPSKKLDISILKDILTGGIEKMREAGVTLVGGHSIDDPELKYGISVTGTVHPDKLLTTNGARPGDKLVLTKPLGTGIVSTAIKSGKASPEIISEVTTCMSTLNKEACELMHQVEVHSCTDVTGFGFIGHAANIARESAIHIQIHSDEIPMLSEVQNFINMGLLPGGLRRNLEFYSNMVKFSTGVPQYIRDVLFDPQTSGGLLIALSTKDAEWLLLKLANKVSLKAAIVGDILSGPLGITIE
jgi:selenide,water dikinase